MNDCLKHDLALRLPRHGWADPVIWLALGAGPAFWVLATGLGGLQPPVAGPPSAATVALALVWYPVLEELLFRGLLQGRLLAWRWGRWRFGISVANLVTAVAFAGLHVAVHPTPWAAAVLIPALVFGGLRERTASVLPAMMVHAGYNASLLGAGWLAG